MASQWYSLVSQKLYLAKALLEQRASMDSATEAPPPLLNEALTQGCVELLLRARQALLVMIARHHQHKQASPATLSELRALLPEDAYEVTTLDALATDGQSWWSHLAQLERAQSQPPATRKSVSADNIIAISAETGPDRSTSTLAATRNALSAFARELEEQNSEW
ncbi:MAG TPA: DUF6586 family protein [Marinobacter sp.]|nr:DUF6586 family protein [Marinobacter sp.]